MKKLLLSIFWVPLSFGLAAQNVVASGLGVGSGIGQGVGAGATASITASQAMFNVKLVGNYALTGAVTSAKKALKGATLALNGNGYSEGKTDAKGSYKFSSLPKAKYTLVPSMPGYTFSPSKKVIGSLAKNTTVKFTAVKKSKLSKQMAPDDAHLEISALSSTAQAATEQFPFGDPVDADGYYSVQGHSIRFLDSSNNPILDMRTNPNAAVAFVEVKIDSNGVTGSLTSPSGVPVAFPLAFGGDLNVSQTMFEGTVTLSNCKFEGGAVFFSSGSMDVSGGGTVQGGVAYDISGTLNVSGDSFTGTLSVTYSYSAGPTPISKTSDMTITVKYDGTGSYSSTDANIGSGTF